MKQKSPHDAHHVKVFSANHNKHEITLKTWGKPSKGTGCEFTARLTRSELAKVSDFITKNFNNDGRK